MTETEWIDRWWLCFAATGWCDYYYYYHRHHPPLVIILLSLFFLRSLSQAVVGGGWWSRAIIRMMIIINPICVLGCVNVRRLLFACWLGEGKPFWSDYLMGFLWDCGISLHWMAPLHLLAMIKAALIISMYTLCECVLPWDELIQGHSFLEKLFWPVATECDLLE